MTSRTTVYDPLVPMWPVADIKQEPNVLHSNRWCEPTVHLVPFSRLSCLIHKPQCLHFHPHVSTFL
ncbi:hypothetical protein Hanom_Chr17g01575401 [Helianthus anomalus]